MLPIFLFSFSYGSQITLAEQFDRFKSTSAQTKYPIVLVGGGVLIFDSIGPIDYFYQIPQALEANGSEVFVSIVSGSNSHDIRGEQLARFVEDVLALTDNEKVNLIGISAGGPTSRYVASVYPDMVASVSTINGGHHGIPMADMVIKGEEIAPNLMSALLSLFDYGVSLIQWLGENDFPQDSSALAYAESAEGLAVFNTLHPEGALTSECGEGAEIGSNGVYYYSMAGDKAFTNTFDPIDYALALSDALFFEQDETSDGIIGTCSSHWGKVIRDDYPLNHVDMNNHLFGLTAFLFDVPNFYVQHANRLKNLGL